MKMPRKHTLSTRSLAAFNHLILPCCSVLSLFYFINIMADLSLHEVVDVENAVLSFCLVQI